MEALSPEREAQCRRNFETWLGQLGSDTQALCRVLEQAELAEGSRRLSAECLNHLLHSLDLIPEGVEALGYLENVFAFRILAERSLRDDPKLALADTSGTLERLGQEATALGEFLGAEHCSRLRSMAVRNAQRARGRQLSELLEDAGARAAALGEARAFADSYGAPSFGSGEQDLVKLRAFVQTRLSLSGV